MQIPFKIAEDPLLLFSTLFLSILHARGVEACVWWGGDAPACVGQAELVSVHCTPC